MSVSPLNTEVYGTVMAPPPSPTSSTRSSWRSSASSSPEANFPSSDDASSTPATSPASTEPQSPSSAAAQLGKSLALDEVPEIRLDDGGILPDEASSALEEDEGDEEDEPSHERRRASAALLHSTLAASQLASSKSASTPTASLPRRSAPSPTLSTGRTASTHASRLILRSASSLLLLAARLSSPSTRSSSSFDQVVDVLSSCFDTRHSPPSPGLFVFSGVGKSGIIARKAVATFCSLGLPSVFVHPVEALHGDMGVLPLPLPPCPIGSPVASERHQPAAALILISYSGTSSELLILAKHLRSRVRSIISVTGVADCPLTRVSDAWLDASLGGIGEMEEALPAPTCSVVTAIAALDAVAMCTARKRARWALDAHRGEAAVVGEVPASEDDGESWDDAQMAEEELEELVKGFAINHPEGAIGKRLAAQSGAPPTLLNPATDARTRRASA